MPTIVSQASTSNHDCLVYKDFFNNWQFDLTNDENSIGYHSQFKRAQGSGLYFPDIPIPPGSTINAAFLILRSSALKLYLGAKSIIFVEENANPIPFTTLADYQSRSRWIVLKFWDFTETEWQKDELYVSPEIGKFVQTVIDLPGWAEGNPIVFFWEDHDERSFSAGNNERIAYSYDKKPSEAPRLEITFTPPIEPPAPPPPSLPTPPPPPRDRFVPLDLEYEYLDDGYRIILYTNVPCHLYCRITAQEPWKHTLPAYRRGLRLTGDIRFCFTVYEDIEQEEPGDTLIHYFILARWPVCHDKWFYFVGSIYGDLAVSETAIFKFHFPGPPPAVPDPISRTIFASENNRTITHSLGAWAPTHDSPTGTILGNYLAPNYLIFAGDNLTATYHIFRGFLDFDTTDLPPTFKIVNAAISIYVESVFPSPGVKPHLYITQGVQNLPPVITNYGGQLPFTAILGQADLTTFTPNAYNDIPLNATGIALIAPLTTSRFCLRGQRDVEDFASVPVYNSFVRFHSEQKGAGYRPLLKLNYYPAERPC